MASASPPLHWWSCCESCGEDLKGKPLKEEVVIEDVDVEVLKRKKQSVAVAVPADERVDDDADVDMEPRHHHEEVVEDAVQTSNSGLQQQLGPRRRGWRVHCPRCDVALMPCRNCFSLRPFSRASTSAASLLAAATSYCALCGFPPCPLKFANARISLGLVAHDPSLFGTWSSVRLLQRWICSPSCAEDDSGVQNSSTASVEDDLDVYLRYKDATLQRAITQLQALTRGEQGVTEVPDGAGLFNKLKPPAKRQRRGVATSHNGVVVGGDGDGGAASAYGIWQHDRMVTDSPPDELYDAQGSTPLPTSVDVSHVERDGDAALGGGHGDAAPTTALLKIAHADVQMLMAQVQALRDSAVLAADRASLRQMGWRRNVLSGQPSHVAALLQLSRSPKYSASSRLGVSVESTCNRIMRFFEAQEGILEAKAQAEAAAIVHAQAARSLSSSDASMAATSRSDDHLPGSTTDRSPRSLKHSQEIEPPTCVLISAVLGRQADVLAEIFESAASPFRTVLVEIGSHLMRVYQELDETTSLVTGESLLAESPWDLHERLTTRKQDSKKSELRAVMDSVRAVDDAKETIRLWTVLYKTISLAVL